VYHAYTRDGHEVAIKVLHSTEPTAGVRFAREIQVLAALPANPSLVRYVDHGATPDGWPLLALEFVDGISLKEGMQRCSALAPGKAVAFLAELCDAFVGLHRLGVAHRDVKPDNILLARQGGIKLIDFGLIRDAQGILSLLEQDDPLDRRLYAEELDQSILVGTPEYMAPEQFSDAAMDNMAEARTDTWSDVYSLGVILFQLLSGWKLFPMREVSEREYPMEILRYMQWRIEITDEALPRCAGLDEALDSILRKALRRDPRQRQPNAQVLMNDLTRYLDSGEGVVEADESRTYVISLDQLMKLQAERDAQPSARYQTAPAPRDLPLIGEDDDEGEEEETVMTAAHSELIDEDSMPQGHTVIFFASFDENEVCEEPLEPPTPAPLEYDAPETQLAMRMPPLAPWGAAAAEEGAAAADTAYPTAGVSAEHTFEDESNPNPWQELTPTNPRPTMNVADIISDLGPSIAESETADELDGWVSPNENELDIYGTIDAPPPNIDDDDLEDDLYGSEEVTNRVPISEVEGSSAPRPVGLLDQVTRKVNVAEVMPEELRRSRRKK